MGFEIKEAKDGRWYYKFLGLNNETMFVSQMYPDKRSANRGRDDARAAVRLDSKETNDKSK